MTVNQTGVKNLPARTEPGFYADIEEKRAETREEFLALSKS